MEKMQAFMERFFVPFAAKINSQRHVAAVRDAFTLSFPLTMAGSMVLLINYVFLDPTGFVASLLHLGDLIPNLADYQAVLSSVINGTTNILAILIAFLVSLSISTRNARRSSFMWNHSFSCLFHFISSSKKFC